MSDLRCSVLLKAERALHFFTHISLWFSTSVQLAEGEQPPPYKPYTNLLRALLGWVCTMVPVLGSMECRGALSESRIQDMHPEDRTCTVLLLERAMQKLN